MDNTIQKAQRLALLGSTGSIGTQTLDVVRAHPDRFVIEMLVANNNWQMLRDQAREFEPDTVIIANSEHYDELQRSLEDLPIKVYTGAEAAEQAVVSSSIDTVVAAMVGFAGLAPTLAAIRSGKKIALANKETLVVAGELVIAESIKHRAPILPVDSEHSAIFQCLVGEQSPPSRIILTASGGPFRDASVSSLHSVTPAQALRHPNWEMGAKVTIDSATMLNKGFEVIEARWLFGLNPDQIGVVVHPQSIIHSFVEFEDGALKAQLGTPDMRLPIQYALSFPERISLGGERYNPATGGNLTFCEPDPLKYPCLDIAYQAMRAGGGAPCVMNAAGEVAVAAFLSQRIRFTDIAVLLAETLDRVPQCTPKSAMEYSQLDGRAREAAMQILAERSSL